MPELLTPGVFVQEVEFGPQPIEGVSTSTAGFVGETMWGPTSGLPLLVTSIADFERKFGGLVQGKTLPYAMRGFFDNGGRRAYVARVAAAEIDVDAAADATRSRAGDVGIDNAARYVRLLAPPNGTQVVLSSVVNIGTAIAFVDRTDRTEVSRTVSAVNGATGVVTLSAAAPAADPSRHYVRIGAPVGAPARLVWLRSRYPGEYADRISVLLEPHFAQRTKVLTVTARPAGDRYELARTDLLSLGEFIQLESADGTAHAVVAIDAIDQGNREIATSVAPDTAFIGGRALLVAWRLTVLYDGQVVETLEGLPTGTFADQLDARSQWLRVQREDGGTPVTVDLDPSVQPAGFPSFDQGRPVPLTGGQDGDAPDATAFVGSSSEPRSGLKSLEAQSGINLIAAPGQTDPVVVDELIGQAERLQDRFAVFEAPLDADLTTVLGERAQYNSRYAAMYHPWLRVRDPLSRTDIAIPPSGHVLGCYARTDNDRGVHKAPANVVIRGITGFRVEVPTGEQDILNPAGVNVLRQLDGLGRVIWGARTITAEGLWKYVPVRRLFLFLEQSIIRGTRFAVFEPNDHRLWARLRDAVTNFLTTQWREGALFGQQPEHAFFVKVDETTTTQDDRDNGRVNILVGIAPVKPAEFIVFRIGQAPSSVILEENA